MKVIKKSRSVLNVRFDDVSKGWEKWFLLTSDRHHDSIDSDGDLVVEHLDEVRKRKAHVLDFGDFFDAMQGKYDPRRTYKEMQKKYIAEMNERDIGYLDVIVDDAIQFYKPYADLFTLISEGNHETSIYQHNDTNLTDRLVSGLNTQAGTKIQKGGYGGWVRFNFTINKTKRTSVNLKYNHGYGGGGPVTKGSIQANRQAVYLPDAHIVVNGHIHESWIITYKRDRISDTGELYQDLQHHVRTGTYKNDYGDGHNNWHIRRGGPPKPMGAIWLRLYLDREKIRIALTQDVR